MFVTSGSLQVPPGTTSAGQQVQAMRLNGPLAAQAACSVPLSSLVRVRIPLVDGSQAGSLLARATGLIA